MLSSPHVSQHETFDLKSEMLERLGRNSIDLDPPRVLLPRASITRSLNREGDGPVLPRSARVVIRLRLATVLHLSSEASMAITKKPSWRSNLCWPSARS